MDLNTLQAMYNEAYNSPNNLNSLKEFAKSKAYADGNQLPPDVRADLETRGQPAFYENIFKKHSNKIAGFNLQSNQRIEAKGRQTNDYALASVLTDLCRVITDRQDYKLQKRKADTDLQHGLCVKSFLT